MLRIDINILFTIINLVILIILVKKFLFGRVNKILDERAAMVAKQFSDAQEAEDAANALKAEYEATLAKAGEDGAQIISDSKAKAREESNNIIANANTQAEGIIADAQRNAKREKDKILKEVEPQVAYMAVQAAAKIVGEECSEEKNKALYDQFLIKAGEASGTEE